MSASKYRYLKCLLFSGLLFVASFGTRGALAQDVYATATPAATTTYICSNTTVPSGYVVISSGTDYRCSGYAVYRWGIQPVSDGIVACLGSSYPNPYFITGESSNTQQCAGFLGQMTLHLPTDGLVACVNGVLWSPWVITGNSNTNPIPCNGYAQIVISQPAVNLRICSNSVIPAGWYVAAWSQFYICQPYLTGNMSKLPAAIAVSKTAPMFYKADGDKAVLMPQGDATQ